MNEIKAVVFIDDEKPVLSFDDSGRLVHELKRECDSFCGNQTRNPQTHQWSGRPVSVFFLNRNTINDLSHKSVVELCKEIEKRFQMEHIPIESFEQIYVCCHFGGGGYYDVYERTVLSNTELNEGAGLREWHILAYSKTLIFPNWLINNNHDLQAFKESSLIYNIETSIEESNRRYLDIVNKFLNVDGITNAIDHFDTSLLDYQNTKGCVVVIGCACESGQLEKLRDVLLQKAGQAEVFICNRDGIAYSTCDDWQESLLSHECISCFHRKHPNAKIFAVSTVPYNEDNTEWHEFFTDWMFAGWIDCFGYDNICFYGNNEDAIRSMLVDLYNGEFASGTKLTADERDCHLWDRYNCLMRRMKH